MDDVSMDLEPVDGSEPDGFEVGFVGRDGVETTGEAYDLPAGKVGTWELRITVHSEVAGGFLFQRRGFLLGHRTQVDNPLGRDYVTLETESEARVALIVNTANQSHQASFAQVVVQEGRLKPGDRFVIRVGDRSEGGPGCEVYDATTMARFGAAVDREGSGVYRKLKASPVQVRIISEPKPDLLRILGPSVVSPGEAFHVNIGVFDPHRNVCEQYEGDVHLDVSEGVEGLPEVVTFGREDAGLKILEGVRVTAPGVHRIEAQDQRASLQATSNPIVCREDPEYRLLWGEFHGHSWGDTTLGLMDAPSFKVHPAKRHEQCRQIGRYDFSAPGMMSPPKQEDQPEIWEAHQQAYRDNDEPGRYVPFLASEVHARPGGDRNVVFKAWSDSYLWQRSSMDVLQAAYGDREDVILEAHVGGGPPDWNAYRTEREPLLEVSSGHGAFEWVLQRALSHGYRPAVIGSSDAHLPAMGTPMAAHCFRGRFNHVLKVRDAAFGSGPIAAVWATRCEREAIWEAIGDRRTFATTGARIVLEVNVNGTPAGGEATLSGPATVAMEAYGCAPVERVDLMRNDRCLKSWFPDTVDVDLEFVDSQPLREGAYYIRLRQTDGEYAWSTPVWTSASEGEEEPGEDLPMWNAHEEVDLSGLRPNAAEAYEADLNQYLEVEEDPKLFSKITPVRLVQEVTGRSALFYGYLGADRIPVSIRWYYEFEIPRIHCDWGWRDFGMRGEEGRGLTG
ncbi:MAG: DUF3604 domain-containing protein [bacterium]|nr:DUF3604 domain-containing protein [bacterium]